MPAHNMPYRAAFGPASGVDTPPTGTKDIEPGPFDPVHVTAYPQLSRGQRVRPPGRCAACGPARLARVRCGDDVGLRCECVGDAPGRVVRVFVRAPGDW
jgi:hypothetical protein